MKMNGSTDGSLRVENLWDAEAARQLDPIERLRYRSNLLGSDFRITNTGGGNTSSKVKMADPLTGEEAERIGLISMAVDDEALDETALRTASRLASMAPSAIHWTKYSLNDWLRQAGPTFDASLALEFLGFTGPEAKEGVAAFREERKPQFPTHSPP